MSSSPNPQTKPRPLADLSGTILLAGAGKMGSAMLEGWLALGLAPEMIAVIEPQPSREIAALRERGLRLNPSRGAVGEVAAVVIAVKPQTADEAMPVLAPFVDGATVVVSIMAGRTLRFLARSLPGAAIVRAMPNTPAAIGRGMTVAVANARVSAAQRALVDALLSAVGGVEWITDRALGLGAGLRIPARRGDGARWHRRGSARSARRHARTRHGRGRRRAAASLAARRRNPAAERDLPRRHHRRRARGADGRGRARTADDRGHRRRHQALARLGGVS
jgi:hypothetical protein